MTSIHGNPHTNTNTDTATTTDVGSLLAHFDLPLLAGTPGTDHIDCFSPGDGQLIGRIAASAPAGFDALMERAVQAARRWADVPAPQRAELVRLLAAQLRQHQRELAELIALENGKIIGEALGEVQEMIDIADFAVGQSRMLYGRTMPSERPQHRLYEQWHPLGVVGIITAFNFPVAVWSWNALLAAGVRQRLHLEALAEDATVCAGGAEPV